MSIARRVFTTAPITTVFVLSAATFWLSVALTPMDTLIPLFFYIFALPWYTASLVGMAVGTSLGIESVAALRLMALGLCLGADLVLFVLIRSARLVGDRD